MRTTFWLAVLVTQFFFAACNNSDQQESATIANDAATETTETITNSTKKSDPIDALRKSSRQASDTFGRTKGALDKVFANLSSSAKEMEGYADPSYSLDEAYNFTYNYTEKGVKYEQKVNLNEMNVSNGGLKLLPEGDAGPYPGFSIRTKNEANVVRVYQGGKLVNKNNEIRLFLQDRAAVEQTLPAFIQAINVMQGNMPD